MGVVTQETPTLVSPSGVAGLTFGDPVEAVNRVAGELTDGDPGNGEADVIVAEYHEGAGAGTPDGSSLEEEVAGGGAFAAIVTQTSAAVDAILFVTPEFNRSIPGALKNAIDWASRPWGQNSFDHMPAAVIGASPGAIGTALGQQSLRAVLSYANARQMTAPEAYITFKPEIYGDDGSVSDESTAQFLRTYMREFRDHIERVLTVLPRTR